MRMAVNPTAADRQEGRLHSDVRRAQPDTTLAACTRFLGRLYIEDRAAVLRPQPEERPWSSDLQSLAFKHDQVVEQGDDR